MNNATESPSCRGCFACACVVAVSPRALAAAARSRACGAARTDRSSVRDRFEQRSITCDDASATRTRVSRISHARLAHLAHHAFGRSRSSRFAARRARLFGRPRRLPGASFLARHAQHNALEEVLAFIGFEALLLVVRVVVRIATAVSRRSRRGAARRSAVSCVGACCLIWAYWCIFAYSFVCETSTY